MFEFQPCVKCYTHLSSLFFLVAVTHLIVGDAELSVEWVFASERPDHVRVALRHALFSPANGLEAETSDGHISVLQRLRAAFFDEARQVLHSEQLNLLLEEL